MIDVRIKKDRWIVAAIGAVVFFSSLMLSLQGDVFLSPDETANAIFSERFANTGTLWLTEPLNNEFAGRIHPRSMTVIGDRIVPGSFLGLPVMFGAAVFVFGSWLLPLLTPLVGFLALFAVYETVRRLFDRQIALFSTVLFAMHPGWWYYTARALMHNVLFTSFVIFCVYFLVARPLQAFSDRHNRAWIADLDVVFAGVMLGLALFTRTSEALWLLVSSLVIVVFFLKKLTARTMLLFFLSLLLGLAPMAFANQSAYGTAGTFGYTVQQAEQDQLVTVRDPNVPAIQVEPTLRDRVETALTPAFPFGIHPRAAARHFSDYAAGMFWWLTILILIGIPLMWPTKQQTREERLDRYRYLALFAVVTGWLTLMYGSWVIRDNPDPNAITLGQSYVRYWLPIYLLSMPFAALAIRWISTRARTEFGRLVSIAAIFVLSFGLSTHLTFFGSTDALVPSTEALAESQAIQNVLLPLIEPDGVVIVDRADKLIFPYRRIVFPLRDESTYQLMPGLVRRAPLYYYGVTFPQVDMEYLNNTKLPPLGLQIELIQTFQAESLYRIYPAL